MSFIKSFFFSMLAFIGLNIAFFFSGVALTENGFEIFFNLLEDRAIAILEPLFGPIYTGMGPEPVLGMALSVDDPEPAVVVFLVGYIVAPFVAAILSGVLGENKGQAWGGWFLTAMITAGIAMIWGILYRVDAGLDHEVISDFAISQIIFGAILGFFYGCFALLALRSI